MDRLGVAVPWNQPSYISANGFHPLYQALFEDNPALEFRALDEAALARELERDRGLYRALVARRERLRGELPARFTDNAIGRRFLEHVTLDELALTEEIPCELELHHTSPFTSGRRPFVLHCESFLPVLRPLWRGTGQLEDAGAVRLFYAHLFAADTCLGIFSHIPATLEQFSRFFADPRIDAKLHPSPVGISEYKLRALQARPPAAGSPPLFLFAGSLDGAPGEFARRGGAAALILAEHYLRAGRQGRFLFRARRPSRAELLRHGVNADFLAAAEGQQISWIEEDLSERERLRLFGLADFVLLPSVNLHSAIIMQALAAGAVPVVSDIVGTDLYVEDGTNGIVLSGVRTAVWHADPDNGVPVEAQAIPDGLASDLAAGMYRRIVEVLDAPGRLEALRAAGRRAAEARFSGARFRDALSEAVARLWRDAGGRAERTRAGRPKSLLGASAIVTGAWERYFGCASQPRMVIDVGVAKVHALRGVYYLVPAALDAEVGPLELNPLTLRNRGELGRFRVRVAASLSELVEPLHFALRRSTGLAARLRYYRLHTANRVKARLQPYKRAYRTVRGAYRAALGALRAVSGVFSGGR